MFTMNTYNEDQAVQQTAPWKKATAAIVLEECDIVQCMRCEEYNHTNTRFRCEHNRDRDENVLVQIDT